MLPGRFHLARPRSVQPCASIARWFLGGLGGEWCWFIIPFSEKAVFSIKPSYWTNKPTSSTMGPHPVYFSGMEGFKEGTNLHCWRCFVNINSQLDFYNLNDIFISCFPSINILFNISLLYISLISHSPHIPHWFYHTNIWFQPSKHSTNDILLIWWSS